ncbi:MAG: HlyD family efflux transporter periplasmic adaptor subunit [Acidimicrobiaceae bacterium]|nr:HlyD family efflux transporter periplasmic adaptor subunit [Acidimicrobiaceae bacterium]
MTIPSPLPSPTVETGAPGDLAPQPTRRRRRRRRRVLVALVVVAALVAAGLGAKAAGLFGKSAPPSPGVADNAYPTSLATVTRQDISSQTQVNATLGYAGTYTAVNQVQGTYTFLPKTGEVVSQGEVLYGVNGKPVVLLYGSTPAYRSLSEGTSTSPVTGADVAELNADLVALGYATSAEIPAGTATYTYWTQVGVEKLQAAHGFSQTGTLTLGEVLFLPTAARITTVTPSPGSPAQVGENLLTASSPARQVSIALDASQQSEVKVGDKVTITLPNNDDTPGVVSSVGTVATTPSGNGGGSGSPSDSGSGPTVTVLVNPTDPAATGSWDQAPVEVSVTTDSVSNALVVPVDALVALSSGGYAVEVVGAGGVHHLVPVSLGLFDSASARVQVSGSGLAAGQRVVVPNT